MEIEQTNDYFLNYSKEWSKPKRVKKPTKKLFTLMYGTQIIEQNKPYVFCKATQNRLKRTGNFNKQTFKII